MALFGGIKLASRHEDVEIGQTEDGEAVVLRLAAPGLCVLRKLRDEIPDPIPPATGPARRDDKGNPLRDGQGCVICESNEDDPRHKAAMESANVARSIALILVAAGESIELDTQREDHVDATAYYLAAWEELEKDGLDVVAFKRLSAAAARLVGVNGEEVKRAKEELEGKPEESPEGFAAS